MVKNDNRANDQGCIKFLTYNSGGGDLTNCRGRKSREGKRNGEGKGKVKKKREKRKGKGEKRMEKGKREGKEGKG